MRRRDKERSQEESNRRKVGSGDASSGNPGRRPGGFPASII